MSTVNRPHVRRSRVPWGSFSAEAVRDLYDDYAALLDDGDYAAWLELFTEDASYMVVARENVERGLPLATIRCESRAMLADRIESVESRQFFVRRIVRHLITAIRPVGLIDAVLEITCNFVVVETLADEPSRVHAVGSYDDRVADIDGALRFRSKTAVYDAPLVLTSLVVPL